MNFKPGRFIEIIIKNDDTNATTYDFIAKITNVDENRVNFIIKEIVKDLNDFIVINKGYSIVRNDRNAKYKELPKELEQKYIVDDF